MAFSWALFVEGVKPLALLGEFDFQTTVNRLIVTALVDGLWQIGLPCSKSIRFMMGVAVRVAMTHAFQQFGGRVAQMHRHLVIRILAYIGHTFIVGLINRITFR